ncbi:MAG: hypothetical protein P4N59_24450 [Negativicutes bacterium]|nr:hypothetical protein [Negativicutes bacterium]
MRCTNCGRELAPQETECIECRQPSREVQVLTREERENFQGVTLDNEPAEKNYYEYQSSGPSHRVYVRQVNFGSGKMGFWTKLLIGAAFAFLIFFLLPMMLFFIAAVSLIWIIIRMISR